jgi:hypothetical protein
MLTERGPASCRNVLAGSVTVPVGAIQLRPDRYTFLLRTFGDHPGTLRIGVKYMPRVLTEVTHVWHSLAAICPSSFAQSVMTAVDARRCPDL